MRRFLIYAISDDPEKLERLEAGCKTSYRSNPGGSESIGAGDSYVELQESMDTRPKTKNAP